MKQSQHTEAVLAETLLAGRAAAAMDPGIAAQSRGDGPGASEDAATASVRGAVLGGAWGRHALSERLAAWGAAGYGQGELTVTPSKPGTDEAGAAVRADLDLWPAAGGLRGELLDPGSGSGLRLTGKTDATVVQTRSGRGRSAGGGHLAPARATVTRLRLGLEGSRPMRLGAGAALTPSVEVGLRRDGGDAERGFGVDVGAGLGWSDRRRGLEAELRGRGLLTHEDGSFGERGVSGSLSWDPRPGSELGPTFTLSRSVGGSVTGGMDALLGRETMAGLAAGDNGGERSRRLEATVGYGVPAFGGRFIGTPAVGVGLSDAGRELRVGWGVGLARREGTVSMDFEFEATRRESANDDREPEHGVGVRFSLRW